MQIPIYVINNMPEPGRNLAADACMGRTQLSPCIYNFSTRTIRASRNAMPAWYFFHAEPLISRFSLEKYITLLQQLWQTVLMWNLYPIFISLNQLAVKITPAESFLWMHLHQFQYLCYILTSVPFMLSLLAISKSLQLCAHWSNTARVNKQRVLMHRHQGWNVRHGLCHIYMRYLYIYELFIAFVCFVVCSLL